MRRLLLLGAAVVAIACDSSKNSVDPVTTPRGVNGAYNLLTINGIATPILLGQNDTAKVELTQSIMTLNTDLSYHEIYSLRLTVPSGIQTQMDTLRGTFAQSGTVLTFQPSDGSGAYQMSVTDEHTLTENDPGYVLVYRRP
jgi:hypothetical protein